MRYIDTIKRAEYCHDGKQMQRNDGFYGQGAIHQMKSLEPWYLTSSSYAVEDTDFVRLGKPLKDFAYVATECAISYMVVSKPCKIEQT
jgi:hypothetical protein